MCNDKGTVVFDQINHIWNIWMNECNICLSTLLCVSKPLSSKYCIIPIAIGDAFSLMYLL